MGESIMEATILKWHKQAGDMVKMDETILDIATDKVDTEVPSTAEGVIEEVMYKVNDVVPVGKVIARIKTGAAQYTANEEAPTPKPDATINKPQQANYQPQETSGSWGASKSSVAGENYTSATSSSNGNKFYSPLVLNIASQEGVSMVELEKIPGTGNEGRVTKRDILQFVNERRSQKPEAGSREFELSSSERQVKSDDRRKADDSSQKTDDRQQQDNLRSSDDREEQMDVSQFRVDREEEEVTQREEAKLPSTVSQQPSSIYGGNVEFIEMDRMRKLIAEHMVRSKHTSPHVTSFTEADVSNLVMWRDKMKKEFERREGTKITYTPLFIEAIVKCIKKFPLINSSVDGDRIIVKKDINIGMATALPSGNLIVPVIKNADQLNLVGLSKRVNTMADNARNNKLRPDDIDGGTFTLTNVGTFGSLMGTPIINQPQVAILAVGAIKKRPVVIETPHGDSIAIRHMMYLSMSYDHRIIDGSLGATFLTALANELENFDAGREI
jgi:2-oxoglutarate dehydrogenase E2 component (dihydrolipoamide succinyltransferase)